MADIAKTIADAQASIADAGSLRLQAANASDTAKMAVEDAKKAASNLSDSIGDIKDVIAQASSFDEQWEAFKRKFDELNSLAISRICGTGVSTEVKRPAEMISVERVAQVVNRASKVVVLTGAGISAESGIPTFRGADGFWTVGSENYRPEELATWEKFNEMPEELWRWYQYRWGICRKAKPNPGHHALVELEKLLPASGEFTLVTQNIDGLHLEAGSDRQHLHEIHGRIDEMRCDERIEGACLHGLDLNDEANFEKVKATLTKTPPPATNEQDEHLSCCSVCGVRQRPKILWFDESYNEAIYGYHSVQEAVKACDVLLIVGTQLTTGLPKTMVRTALSKGTTIIKMDTIVDLSDESSAGMLHLQAKSGEALPQILAELRRLRKEPALAPLAQLPKGVVELPTLLAPSTSLSKPGKLSSLQPLQGSPASSLRRNSSVANAKLGGAPAAALPGNARRNLSPAPKKAPGTPPLSKALQSAASAGRISAARKPIAGSAALSKEVAANSTCTESKIGFFVYGTLRPDDDSNASWTKSFCEGMVSEVAFLPGASLYIDGAYPAVSLEETRCSVRGQFLQPASGKMLSTKLLEADGIEGYPDLYDRVVATVHTESGAARRAYVYHRTGRTDRTLCTRVPDGDWLSRKRVGG